MGSRGPLPKPADQLHGHRKRRERTVAASENDTTPKPADAWLPPTQEAWKAYWASDLSRSALDTDMPVIRRLFELYDQYERSMSVVRRALVVKGSMGQIRANPLADHALKLEVAILRLENELGLTPMARIRLGINVVRRVEPQAEVPEVTGGKYGYLRAVG